MMTRRQRFLSIVIGLIGAVGSVVALVEFLLRVRRNGLVFPKGPPPQSFYQSVGTAYSGGFVAEFSLCFFLTLLAVAVGTWVESRRSAAAMNTESVRMPMVRPVPRG
jgi:hypothetical protein